MPTCYSAETIVPKPPLVRRTSSGGSAPAGSGGAWQTCQHPFALLERRLVSNWRAENS